MKHSPWSKDVKNSLKKEKARVLAKVIIPTAQAVTNIRITTVDPKVNTVLLQQKALREQMLP